MRSCYWSNPPTCPGYSHMSDQWCVRMCAFLTKVHSEDTRVYSERFLAAMLFKIRPAIKADCKDISRMIMVRGRTLTTQRATVFLCWTWRARSSTLLPRSWQCLRKCPIKLRYLMKVLSGTIWQTILALGSSWLHSDLYCPFTFTI